MDGSPTPTRVYLLDDHEVVRQGLRLLVNGVDDIVVIGESASAVQARSEILELLPDVAILDARLPDGSGIEVAAEVRQAAPSVRVLILTSFEQDEHALISAIRAGVSGYILKDVKQFELLDAIRRVAEGHSLIDPKLLGSVLQRLRAAPTEDDVLSRLSARETDLLRLIARGLSNREIAERLSLTENTVKGYVSTLLGKLGVQRRTQAAVLAAELLKPD